MSATDYQPVAAQVYERLQGLRREAYDSSDYVEGLNASSKNASHPSEALTDQNPRHDRLAVPPP